MRVIRRNVFETNSSSTHSISIVSKEDFEKWKNGELLYNNWGDNLVEKTEENADDEDMYTYDGFFDDEYLEGYVERYTTKGGDEIVAFGKYRMDN